MDGILGFASDHTLQLIVAAISAIAALGMAAMALVDASKAFWGGVSNVGFGHILAACTPFRNVLRRATGDDDWTLLLRAQWRNGRGKDDQKAVLRSLVRLGITEGEVRELAAISNVDPAVLSAVSEKLQNGAPLEPADINTLGRIDAVIGMRIDAAFERADQQYRNVARVCAGVVSIVLSIAVGRLIEADGSVDSAAILAGALAVPIAPIAKDLVSALTASMQAVKAVRRV